MPSSSTVNRMSPPSRKVKADAAQQQPQGDTAEPTAASTGLGVLLLLLAALPLSEVSEGMYLKTKTKASNEPPRFSSSDNYKPTLSSTPNLCYMASTMQRELAAAHDALMAKLQAEKEEEEEEERRRRRKGRKGGAKTIAPSVSSASSDEELDRSSQFTDECPSDEVSSGLGVLSPDASFCSTAVVGAGSSTAKRSLTRTLSADLLSTVSSYLALKDALQARMVNSAMKAASLVKAMPQNHMLFVRLPRGIAELHQNKGRYAAAPSRSTLRWTCFACQLANSFDMAECRRCGASSDTSNGVCRVFVGQLWKDQTVELTQWLLGFVAPDVSPLHIEPHTMKETGRGKGCAWVYLNNRDGLENVLALHKRAFIDVVPTGGRNAPREEGVWLCSEKKADELHALSQEHAFRHGRPMRLPRQPVVSELPLPRQHSAPTSWNAKRATSNSGPHSVAARSTPFHPPPRTAHQVRAVALAAVSGTDDSAFPYPPPAPTVVVKGGAAWRHDPYAVPVLQTSQAAWNGSSHYPHEAYDDAYDCQQHAAGGFFSHNPYAMPLSEETVNELLAAGYYGGNNGFC